MKKRTEMIDAKQLQLEMHAKGYSILENVLTRDECDLLREGYGQSDLYRKTIVMERYRFGIGEYKYFRYPLPGIIQQIRKALYEFLAPIANEWMERLNIDTRYPESHEAFLDFCHQNQQEKATVLMLKYAKGGYNCLHQDLYGEIFFPIQVVLFLTEPGKDYEGGEFVMTEQIPRAQSKAIVLKPGKGDMLVFTTNFKPMKGSRGYYRVNMKHGVSEITRGNRFTLGIIFHDARS